MPGPKRNTPAERAEWSLREALKAATLRPEQAAAIRILLDVVDAPERKRVLEMVDGLMDIRNMGAVTAHEVVWKLLRMLAQGDGAMTR